MYEITAEDPADVVHALIEWHEKQIQVAESHLPRLPSERERAALRVRTQVHRDTLAFLQTLRIKSPYPAGTVSIPKFLPFRAKG